MASSRIGIEMVNVRSVQLYYVLNKWSGVYDPSLCSFIYLKLTRYSVLGAAKSGLPVHLSVNSQPQLLVLLIFI